ncbi:MAG TPA: adenosine deaminase [Acidobacteriaceae bacterium]|nr:adenosine deaminase [Acidobacteriaceae bacterium]
MVRRSISYLFAVLVLAAALRTHAETPGEARADRVLEAAKKAGNPELYALLRTMPKGADLHMHLSGAVYAETFIDDAARDGLCVAPVEPGLPPVAVGQDAVHLVAPQDGKSNKCDRGQVPASDAFKNQALYDELIDSFSMRAFVATEGIDGHDQFFATFARFGGLKDHSGEWLDEVATRAAAQNEQYLEIMQTPTFSRAAALAYKTGWPEGAENSITPAQLAAVRDRLIASGLRDEVPVDRAELSHALETRNHIEHCNLPNDASPACHVQIHFLYQVLRGFPPQQVFAQTLLGFEVASADPDVVGINFVMPEDGYISMRDYHLQMQMLDYLHSVYPKVHITLHAGELAPGMVPPAGLTFHIREAVNLGHAERIGHGVDILYEDNPLRLLHEMATKHIMVEVNLTSNDVILGIAGADHPLHAYLASHVPFALSTDDEGVSRIDLTHEYVKAADEQDLTYAELKQSARASLEHSFLHGESLYVTPDDFAHRKPVCAAPIAANSTPSRACQALLDANEKAAQQWELERRFAVYEASLR